MRPVVLRKVSGVAATAAVPCTTSPFAAGLYSIAGWLSVLPWRLCR